MRRRLLLAAMAATIPPCRVLAASAAPRAPPEKPKLTLAVGGKSTLYYLPLLIAEQKGYFAEQGLQLDIADFAGGARALQALIGGSADVVSGAYEHTLQMLAKGQHIRAFVLEGQAPQLVFGYSTKKIPNYRTLADLKGAKIGVSAPGSSSHMLVSHVLSAAGLAAGDYSIVGVGSGQQSVSAYTSGQIDATSTAEPIVSTIQKGGDFAILADTRTLKGTQTVFGGPMPAACLYAPEAFVKSNPNTCIALATGILRALAWIRTAGPSEIIKTVPEAYLLGDRALYLQAFMNVREAYSPDGLFSAAGAQTIKTVLSRFNPEIRGADLDTSLTWTNEFVTASAATLK